MYNQVSVNLGGGFAGLHPVSDPAASMQEGNMSLLRDEDRKCPYRERKPFAPRFWGRAILAPSGCREWQGSLGSNGYGQVYYRGRQHKAHRVSWIESHGTIPAGLCVLHRCDNRRCINPEHLFLGTVADNARDMMEKGRCSHAVVGLAAKLSVRTHCGNGHEFSESNTMWRTDGSRRCKICNRMHQNANKRRRMAALDRAPGGMS